MQRNRSFDYSRVIVRWAGAVLCVLLWGATAFSQVIDVYQWTDSNGVINFTDNLKLVPDAIRDSPELIVRKDLFVFDTPSSLATDQLYPQKSRFGPPELKPYPVQHSPNINIYPPDPVTNVIVVNSGFRRVKKRHFPTFGHRGRSFRKNKLGRQYIHPEARSGNRTQYIHPEASRQTRASRQPRPSSRRGFAGRRNFHRGVITGRRR